MSDVASYKDIWKAAEQLYRTCVTSDQRTQGGYVRDIGKQDLDMIPHIQYHEVSIRPENIDIPYRTHLILETT